jgi:hypothetical protein
MKKSIGANTIIYPTPVLIVGTYDGEGKPNVMTVAWGGICCSDPPCIAISLRKATYTYGNICRQKAFTVSIPSEKHARCADYFGIASGKKVDKLNVSGLTPVKSALVKESEKVKVVPRYYGFHALRHFMASYLMDEENVSLKTVSGLLRHKNVRTTELYLHSVDESQLAASVKIKGKFTSELAKPPQEAATKQKGGDG